MCSLGNNQILMPRVFFTQVTIRASLTGKTPTQHCSFDRTGITVRPDSISQRASQPLIKSKSNVTGAVKANTGPPSKKQCGNSTRNNLALRNLR